MFWEEGTASVGVTISIKEDMDTSLRMGCDKADDVAIIEGLDVDLTF